MQVLPYTAHEEVAQALVGGGSPGKFPFHDWHKVAEDLIDFITCKKVGYLQRTPCFLRHFTELII